MPRAGSLNDRIQFERRLVDRSNPLAVDIRWIPEPVLWPAAIERTSEMSVRFTIHFRADVRPDSHRIVWEGRIWGIASAVHDARRRQLTIDADVVTLVETTQLDSDTREFLDEVPAIRPRE